MKNILITIISAIVIFILFLFITTRETGMTLLQVNNSLFITGALILLQGLITHVSNNGGFDALKFSAHTIISFKHRMTYAEYKMKTMDKEKKSFSYALIIGGVIIISALIMIPFIY